MRPVGDDSTTPATPSTPVGASPAPLAPARTSRRRRNQICIVIIAVGLVNFLVYTLGYALLGGDAHNGYCRRLTESDGSMRTIYIVRGHHVRNLAGLETQVSRELWIYSYVHSITVPLTSGALIISMLVLARPHILATMRTGWLSGQVFVVAFGAIVVLISLAAALLFIGHFAAQLAGA